MSPAHDRLDAPRSPGARRRRAARRPQHRGSSSAAAPAGSARPRPPRRWRCGPPSGVAMSACSRSTRLAGSRSRWVSPSWTTTRARSRASTGDGARSHAMMLDMKRTFDEFVEAHADPDRAAADAGQPVLPGAVELVRGHAGVHGDGEARAAARPGRRRAAPGTSSWSTPRRRGRRWTSSTPRSGSGRSWTAGSSGCWPRPPEAAGRGIGQVMGAGFGLFTGVLTKILGAQVLTDVQTFVGARHALRRLPRAGRRRPTRCCRTAAPRSSWSPPPSATRCARRRTSSSG